MVTIKATRKYFDIQRGVHVVTDEEYEVTEERAAQIIGAGYAQAVTEAAVSVSAGENAEAPKPKRARRAKKAE